MGQTRNNNLSPLPFYTRLEEQNHRYPWAYGDIYPLRCDVSLLPFFFVRKAVKDRIKGKMLGSTEFFEGYITADGSQYVENGSDINNYDAPSSKWIWLDNIPYPKQVEGQNTVNIMERTAGGSTIFTNVLGKPGELYSGFHRLRAATAEFFVQTGLGDYRDGNVFDAVQVPSTIKSAVLVSCDGKMEIDIKPDIVPFIKVVNNGDYDVIYYDAQEQVIPANVLDGTYYLRLSDGQNVWYSELFSYSPTVPSVRLSWRDVKDLSLGTDYIPYSDGYENFVWLNTAVGRPEYEIEKEGDERDGYFFMEKGISRKSYRMTFFAPEYLCDALRLVPVSDVVKIWDTSRGASVVYDVDDVDMEVEWLEQGNYASVTITFHTDTVVKNLGKII